MGQKGCEEGDGEGGIETLLRESKSLSSRILEKWFRWYIFLKVINFRNVFMSTIYTDAINQQSNYAERVVKGVSLRLTVKKLYYQPANPTGLVGFADLSLYCCQATIM